MSGSSLGLLLVFAGLVLVVLGVLIWLGGLSWFGQLPGDIRIERDTVRIYVPITSMLLLSLALSLALYVLRRLM